MTREASSQMQERYTAMSTYRSEAERDASGRSCSWAAATSSQFFNRDSEDQAIGWSDYRHKYTSVIDQSGYDKSCRHTFGYGFHKTRVESRMNRNYEEREEAINFNQNAIGGGTDDTLPIYGIEWNNPVDVNLTPPFIHVSDIPNNPAYDYIYPIVNGVEACLEDLDELGVPHCSLEDKPRYFPSAGSGINGNFDFSVGIPLIGMIKISWQEGENRRQYFHCISSSGVTKTNRLRDASDIRLGQTDAFEPDNTTYSNENSTVLHLVRKYGTMTRRSTTDNDAAEQAEGISTGIANSESERNAQATAYSQSRSEAEAVRHSESHFRRTERANNDMVSAKYGQISRHLKTLWDRVWEHLQMLEKQFAAKPYGGKLNCPKDNKSCLPVRRSYTELRAIIRG